MAGKYSEKRKRIDIIAEKTEQLLTNFSTEIYDTIFARLLSARNLDAECEIIALLLQKNSTLLLANDSSEANRQKVNTSSHESHSNTDEEQSNYTVRYDEDIAEPPINDLRSPVNEAAILEETEIANNIIFGRLSAAAPDIDNEFEVITSEVERTSPAPPASAFQVKLQNTSTDDEQVSSIEKQQLTEADIANQTLMARLRLKNAPPMSAEARSALFEYRNLIQQQNNSDVQETTVLIVDKQETDTRDSAVLEKVEFIMKTFPQATFDDVFDRLSTAIDIDKESEAIINEFEDLPGPSKRDAERKNNMPTFAASAEATKFLCTIEEKLTLNEVCQRLPDQNPLEVAQLISESSQKDVEYIIELILTGRKEVISGAFVDDDANDALMVAEFQEKIGRASPFLSSNEEWQLFFQLRMIFPDADQIFLAETIADAEEKGIDHLSNVLTQKGYRTRRERIDKENKERRRRMFLGIDKTTFNATEFLKIYPDPEAYFTNPERSVTENYKQHAKVFLMNAFPDLHEDFIVALMDHFDDLLLFSYRFINEGGLAFDEMKSAFPKQSKRRMEQLIYPEQLDEAFFREVQYCLNDNTINDSFTVSAIIRQEKFDEARKRGILVECPICTSDEILPDEMIECNGFAQRHEYCRQCVKNYAENQIGTGAHFVRCMADDCDAGQFSLATLQTVLDGRVLQLLVKRAQHEELRAAHLDNLYSCPFCDFSIIIDTEGERLFRCQNPDCLRESCLECHEPSHIPLKCAEVERDVETQRRVFIENHMAEAMKRHCPVCKKPILKQSGCNKMTCPCGVLFCYICGVNLATVNPYEHFNSGACLLHSPVERLHGEAARKAGEEAKKKFNTENPERAKLLREQKDVDVNKLV